MEDTNCLLQKLKKFKNEPIFWPVIIFASSILLVFLGVYYLFSSPSSFPPNFLFKVEEGKTLRGISLSLKEDNIIRSRLAFEAFTITYGGERHIREGYYLFEDRTPVFEVARRIIEGNSHLSPIKITIPEGRNSTEIAEIFSKKLPDFNTEKFLVQAKEREGYLFPDTYFFSINENEEDVLKRMENNFKKRIRPFLLEINSSGRSEEQIIILASLLEKEALGQEDRAIIAGILLKRLALGMPLQADAALETYKEKGLPEKPISNPGLGAIVDALRPQSSPYLYYLHDRDGIVHYAKTFTEHKANIKKYLE